MENESLFRWVFVVIFFAMIAIRVYYHRIAKTWRGGRAALQNEGKSFLALRALLTVPFYVGLFAYILNPEWMSWSSLAIPTGWRWLGAILAALTLPLLIWVHRALGTNFSTTLHIRDDHTLSLTGPYRYVRHPMYTVSVVLLIGSLLLTANWFIGLGGLLALGIVMIFRTPKEEAQLLEKFGDEYRQYATRTGRFLPRIS